MTKPLTQDGDEVREMTDEEYARYLIIIGESAPTEEAQPSTDVG
jgi:hypothetical protein